MVLSAPAGPLKQVELRVTLLDWIAPALPPGLIRLIQADRGLGPSPDWLRAIVARGGYLEGRGQKNTRLRREAQAACPLATLVSSAGQTWRGTGKVFKKAGGLTGRVLGVSGRPLSLGDGLGLRYPLLARGRFPRLEA